MGKVTVRPPVGYTREMRLVSRMLKDRMQCDLAQFIARRRLPGPDWMSWEGIGYELRDRIGEEFTREAVRRWAMRYGIPVTTTADGGQPMVNRFRSLVTARGIDICPPLP